MTGKYLTYLILILLPLQLVSQNTFEFFLEDTLRKWTNTAIEDEEGNFVTIVSELTGKEYSPSEINSAYILKIGKNGDTSTRRYSFGDTLFFFGEIFKPKSSEFLVTGRAKLPGSEDVFLFLMKTDASFDPIWVKYHFLTGAFSAGIKRVFRLGDHYLLAGHICDFPCAGIAPYFLKIDNQGNVVYSYIYDDETGQGLFEYLISPDSGRIWCLSPPGLAPINGASRAVFDTAFNYLYSESMPEHSMGRITAKWSSDSTFVIGYKDRRPGAPYQDDEHFIGIYDTALNVKNLNYFGTPDTNDVPAGRQSIDFRHPDSIFFAGWKNQDIGYPSPNAVSWIMTGQVNSQLQPRYLHFIGGDAYYETNYIVATRDGGSLICAGKFSQEKVVYDLLFIKLNSEGVMVGTSSPGIPISKALVYPNPATDRLFVETGLRNSRLEIFGLDGRPVLRQQLQSLKNEININHLRPGAYFYTISTPSGYFESGKFIKQ